MLPLEALRFTPLTYYILVKLGCISLKKKSQSFDPICPPTIPVGSSNRNFTLVGTLTTYSPDPPTPTPNPNSTHPINLDKDHQQMKANPQGTMRKLMFLPDSSFYTLPLKEQ